MPEGARKIPPWEMDASNEPKSEAHLVSNAEEIDAKRAERERQTELREQESALLERIQSGKYKLPRPSSAFSRARKKLVESVSRFKQLGESATELRAVKKAVHEFTEHEEFVRDKWKDTIDSTPDIPDSVEYDKEHVLARVLDRNNGWFDASEFQPSLGSNLPQFQ